MSSNDIIDQALSGLDKENAFPVCFLSVRVAEFIACPENAIWYRQ
jgi:hypothetical protein